MVQRWVVRSHRVRSAMEFIIQVPDEIAGRLAAGPGEMPRRILEALALEGYRGGRLNQAQVAEMLTLSRWETENFLDQHHARRPYTAQMLEEDRKTLVGLPPK